jgi:hypothetical protein
MRGRSFTYAALADVFPALLIYILGRNPLAFQLFSRRLHARLNDRSFGDSAHALTFRIFPPLTRHALSPDPGRLASHIDTPLLLIFTFRSLLDLTAPRPSISSPPGYISRALTYLKTLP